MREMDNEHSVENITVTYKDGHTEKYKIFMAVVADDMMVAGRIGGEICYMPGEKFSTKGITHFATTAFVLVAIIRTFNTLIKQIFDSADAKMLGDILMAEISIGTNVKDSRIDIKTKTIKPEEN